MKRTVSLLLAALLLVTFAACTGSRTAHVDPTAVPGDPVQHGSTDSVKVTPAPTEDPVIIPDHRTSLVHHNEIGTVYISPEGNMYAIQGENLDGIFGGAECETSILDGGEVYYIKPGSTPALLDTNVEKACFMFYSRYENKYYGTYTESLVYLKKDGTVWLRGSNPHKIFGSFVRAEEPVKLLDGAANIGSDDFSVTVGLEDGRILAWDCRETNRKGKAFVIAENADTTVLCGDRLFMTAEGELFVDTAFESGKRFSYTSFGSGYSSFGIFGTNFWTISEGDGAFTYYRRAAGDSEYKPAVTAEGAVFASSSVGARGWCLITGNGLCKAYSVSGDGLGSAPDAVLCGMDGWSLWVIKADGSLSISEKSGGMKTIADHVLFAVSGPIQGTCLFETEDGRLWSYGFCSPEDVPANACYEIALP